MTLAETVRQTLVAQTNALGFRSIAVRCKSCGKKSAVCVFTDRQGNLSGGISFKCKFCPAFNIQEFAELLT